MKPHAVYAYGRLLEGADWNMPQESDIAQAKVVCLDPLFARPAARVAETAFNSGIPVVTIDCSYDEVSEFVSDRPAPIRPKGRD
jgi:hypothetical protein